jgi:hypothetical protein
MNNDNKCDGCDDCHKCNKCNKCDRLFSCISSLNQHLKVSKTCGSERLLCNHCNKLFASNANLKKHILNSCPKKKEKDQEQYNYEVKITEQENNFKNRLKEQEDIYQNKLKDQDIYYDTLIREEHMSKERCKSEAKAKEALYIKQIEKLEKTVEDLHDKIAKLAATKSVSSVTNINNNNQNITLNMFITPEFVKNQTSAHLTYNHFADGIRGIANFVHDFILMDNSGKLIYACYDKARHIFRYKDNDGNEIDDINAEKLIAIVGKPIKEKFLSIYNQLEEDITRYQSIIDDEEEGYDMKKDAKERKARAELSLKVMDLQSNDICTIGMSKNKKLSREIEKVSLVIK